jgi:hypothetical protein
MMSRRKRIKISQLPPPLQEAFKFLRRRYPRAKIQTDSMMLTVTLAGGNRTVRFYGPDTAGNEGRIMVADTIYVAGTTVREAVQQWHAARTL